MYTLAGGDITKASYIWNNVTRDEALDWIDLNAFDMWKMKKEHGDD